MRLAILLIAAAGLLAGCGGADGVEPLGSATTTAPSPGGEPSTGPGSAGSAAASGRYVVLTSLLGKQLPKEPGCRFAKTFTADKPSSASYDGAGTLVVACPKSGAVRPVGQIVNRRGSTPSELTCRNPGEPALYCVYVPSTNLGMFFTGTDVGVTRRRLQHLRDAVAKLPAGITPLSGTSAP